MTGSPVVEDTAAEPRFEPRGGKVARPSNERLLAAIEGLGARVGGLDGRMERVENQLLALYSRVDTLIDSVADIRVELAHHRHDD